MWAEMMVIMETSEETSNGNGKGQGRPGKVRYRTVRNTSLVRFHRSWPSLGLRLCEAARLWDIGWAPHDFQFPSSFEALGTATAGHSGRVGRRWHCGATR